MLQKIMHVIPMTFGQGDPSFTKNFSQKVVYLNTFVVARVCVDLC